MSSTAPGEPLDLGQLLISQGLVTEEAVRECLAIQRESERRHRDTVPRLGELLVQKGYLTEKQVVDALAAQQKRIYYCPRCDVQVNVVARPDAREYKCARCEGTLTRPGNLRDLRVVDSSIIFISRDPVPKEVIEAAKDSARRFGKYILVNEIGRGAVGVIHRAWDSYLNQYVALKMIKPPPEAAGSSDRSTWHETRVLSLFKEARSAVRLRHPNIVPIYDVGRIGRDFFISMEYLEGATLAEHLRKARDEGNVSPFYEEPKKYLRVVRDIARALHYAHTRPAPIIHCDLKPSNVFLDRSGRGYILDFGLAKDLRTVQADQPGTIRGTPAYMAPEQAAGHPDQIDARTDVYAVGAILYELLAGRPPFIGDTMDLLRQAIREKPLRPSEVVAYPTTENREATTWRLVKVPAELENICLRCLEKDRDDRFATAKEVFEALDKLLKGDVTQRREAGLTTLKEPEDDAAAYDEPRSGVMPSAPAPARPRAAEAAGNPHPNPQAAPTPTPVPTGHATPTPVAGNPALPGTPPPASHASRPTSSWAWALTGAAAMAIILLLIANLVWPRTDAEGLWRAAMKQVDRDMATLRTEAATQELQRVAAALPETRAGAEALMVDLDYVDRMRRTLRDTLGGRERVRLEKIELRDGRSFTDLLVQNASDTNFTAIAGGTLVQIELSEIMPERVLSLLGGQQPPDVRYGLAVYLAKNGHLAEARKVLEALLQSRTELDVLASRLLRRIAPPK